MHPDKVLYIFVVLLCSCYASMDSKCIALHLTGYVELRNDSYLTDRMRYSTMYIRLGDRLVLLSTQYVPDISVRSCPLHMVRDQCMKLLPTGYNTTSLDPFLVCCPGLLTPSLHEERSGLVENTTPSSVPGFMICPS